MFTKEVWNGYPFWKKALLGTIGFFAVLIILSIAKTLFFDAVSGLNTGFYRMEKASLQSPAASKGFSVSDALNFGSAGNSTSPSENGVATENNTEEYEALTYSVLFKKGDHERICTAIESWKPLTYVVFENAEQGDTWCRYSFKVERAQAEEVVEELQELGPEEFRANTKSIRRQVVEFESQLSILLQKQDMLETLLADATEAYDGLTSLATDVEDIESLTKIIDSKLKTIESLTAQRIRLAQEIDVLARRSADLSDRLYYATFTVTVQKYRVFDLTSIKDSWVLQLRGFVHDVNSTLQGLTLGTLSLLLQFAVVLVYVSLIGGVAIVFLKYARQFFRRTWKSGAE